MGLLRALNPAINKAAICCGSRGEGASIDADGLCRGPSQGGAPEGINEEVVQ
jgi:hypothetical protein